MIGVIIALFLLVSGGGVFLFTKIYKLIQNENLVAASLLEQPVKIVKENNQITNQYQQQTKSVQSVASNKIPLLTHSIGAEMTDLARLDKSVSNEIMSQKKEERALTQVVPEQQATQVLTEEQLETEEKKEQKEIDTEELQKKVEPYKTLIEQASKEFGIEQSWITAVIEQESRFDEKAINVNTDGTIDRGLMQINSKTVLEITKKLGLTYTEGMEFDPAINIRMGTFYLKENMKQNPDIHYIFTAYNKGPTGAAEWFEDKGTYASEYSTSVIEKIKKYDLFMKRL